MISELTPETPIPTEHKPRLEMRPASGPIPNITIPKRGLIALVLIQMQDDGTKRASAETATMTMVMCVEIH